MKKRFPSLLLAVAIFLSILCGACAAAEATPQTANPAPGKVLFIGNSILLGVNHFLDEEGNDAFPKDRTYAFGLCATDHTKDYYWQVREAILEKNPDAEFFRLYGVPFEALESTEEFDALWRSTPNPYSGAPMCESFTPDLDLIIIQLGDNVNTDERAKAFATNIYSLIINAWEASPRARILWVDSWYQYKRNHSTIFAASHRLGFEEVDIHTLKTDENRGIEGQLIETERGTFVPTQPTSLGHPGDDGMAAIAEAILAQLDL